VEWFPARLRHILDNLLSNALKYRDPDRSRPGYAWGCECRRKGMSFRVSDNGLGLPPGENEQMFELFYRAAPARAAGLGVGLAVVKMLVEQSGGTLTVDSGEGREARFVVVLRAMTSMTISSKPSGGGVCYADQLSGGLPPRELCLDRQLAAFILRGGPDAEIVSMQRAWFRCPRCQRDWEVRIADDRVTVLPA